MALDLPTAAVGWTHREAVVNGVRLHYVEMGEGSLVILLHGFPEFWYSWRHQIPALAAAGFRVIAPDMRGYNRSEKPRGVGSYRMEALTADVAALLRHAGAERATIVGHDWGGAVAWQMPVRYPELVERLVVLNAPHPNAMARALLRGSQLRRSWYIFAFQIPALPEATFAAFNGALLARLFRKDPVRRDAFSEADIGRYRRAFHRPGTLTAAINYYRAAVRRNPLEALRGDGRIACPTLLIWGERDRALGVELSEGLERWVPDIRVERLPDASHWVQNDAPERVNALLLEFLGSPPPDRGRRTETPADAESVDDSA